MPLAIYALALAAFAIGSAEFIISGILPALATDLAVSIPTAGLLVTAYAIGVAIGGPILSVLTARFPPKPILVIVMGIFAVANDRNHALRLMDLGVNDVIRRAYFSSLEMSRRLLVTLGESEDGAKRAIETFRAHDEGTLLKQQAVFRDEKELIQSAQDAARELEQLFETDRKP